jgi:DNA repair protein SbcC/Rad50
VRIAELSLRNYRIFEEVDLELPARVIGIFGVNGAGKSALVESIQYSLYGRARTAKDQIRTQGILTDCVVRLAFEHGGNQYEVRRTISGKNHKTDAELFVGGMQLATGVTEVDAEIRKLLRMDHQVFRASVFAEQKQLDAFSDVTKAKRQEMVLRLLGIKPVDEARTAARKESRDSKGKADDLARELPETAALEADLARAREEAAAAEEAARASAEALGEARLRSEAAEKAFAEADVVRQRMEQIVALRIARTEEAGRLEAQHRALSERIEALRKDLEVLPALETEFASVQGAAERVQEAHRLRDLAKEVRGAEAELEQLPRADPAAALAELQGTEQELDEARTAAAEARASDQQIRAGLLRATEAMDNAATLDPTRPCPTCRQPLGEGFETYVEHCRLEVRALEARLASAARESKAAEARVKRAEARRIVAVKQGEDVQRAATARTALERELAKLREKAGELQRVFGEEPPDLGRLEALANRERELAKLLGKLEGSRSHLAENELHVKSVRNDLDACRSTIGQLNGEAATLAFDPEEHDRVRKERDEARVLLQEAHSTERESADRARESAGEAKRLQDLLAQVEQMARRVTELRDEARYVERVAVLLDGFRDHLVARIGPELSREAEALFRDLTNREYEDLRVNEDDLSIEISDGGRYFPVERFSGSETDLANLALRVAISMHLSRVSGADIGMMILDEVLASLDQERKDLMVQTMGKLSSRFHQLFVITHADQVKDQFPASIQVTKVGRRRSEAVLV